MKLSITKNPDKLEAALADVNGRAVVHTYTTASEIRGLAADAESELDGIGIPKTSRIGARYTAVSGERVSNSYARRGFWRVATCVTLQCYPTGWFVVDIRRTEVGQRGGSRLLNITPDQLGIAEAALRQRFAVYNIAEEA